MINKEFFALPEHERQMIGQTVSHCPILEKLGSGGKADLQARRSVSHGRTQSPAGTHCGRQAGARAHPATWMSSSRYRKGEWPLRHSIHPACHFYELRINQAFDRSIVDFTILFRASAIAYGYPPAIRASTPDCAFSISII